MSPVREQPAQPPDPRRVKVWVDAQLSPAIARWLATTFGIEAVAVKDLGFRDADDQDVFLAARQAGAIVMTKDSDFAELVLRNGPPPQILWVTCGNTSNQRLQEILRKAWPEAAALLESGEPLVELGERTT